MQRLRGLTRCAQGGDSVPAKKPEETEEERKARRAAKKEARKGETPEEREARRAMKKAKKLRKQLKKAAAAAAGPHQVHPPALSEKSLMPFCVSGVVKCLACFVLLRGRDRQSR